MATFGNSVTTVGDSAETIGGVCDINCIIISKIFENNEVDDPMN